MKFTMALIYALAAALLMGLFGAYVYFSVLEAKTGNFTDTAAANVALLLFTLALATFSLALIWLESIPDETPQSPLEKYIAETRDEEIKAKYYTEQTKPFEQKLNQISELLSQTNKTLNLGLERLSTRIDEVENTFLDTNLNLNTSENDESKELHTQQKLAEIFNDDLADTLSGLEIMKDSKKNENKEPEYEEIDLDTLLNNVAEKK